MFSNSILAQNFSQPNKFEFKLDFSVPETRIVPSRPYKLYYSLAPVIENVPPEATPETKHVSSNRKSTGGVRLAGIYLYYKHNIEIEFLKSNSSFVATLDTNLISILGFAK